VVVRILWMNFAMTIFVMLAQYCSCDPLLRPGREINFSTGQTFQG
jgi:hypothetical protein